MQRNGIAGSAARGVAGHGQVRVARAWQAWIGKAGKRGERPGMAGTARPGKARHGPARHGRHGMTWRGETGTGLAPQVWRGCAGSNRGR